jgi:iron complex outermembrane receptor protein/vitamin B12 transporter
LSFVRRHYIRFWTLLLFWSLFLGNSTLASPPGTLRGQVLDPLGAAVPSATVTLVRNNDSVTTTKTNQEGIFEFTVSDSGRYSVHVEATRFQNQDSPSVFVSAAATINQDVRLQIGPIAQQVVVSATGSETPDSQVGASVSVIDHSQLQDLNKLDVLEDLRIVPGVQVVQTGQRGGTTSISILGGNGDFNKVLLDGIPMNDIGGSLEFANIATGGVDSVEILRGSDSVLYGTDALGGVINLTMRHGTTTTPELTYTGDGGNFGTGQNDVSLAGAFHQFDYFSDFSQFETRNSVPNDSFHNNTYAGNFGWEVNGTTDIRFTVRHTAVGLGDPNALDFYGIPDDSSQKEQDTYWGITLRNQTTTHWRNLVRFASTQLNFQFVNPSPTGIPVDGNFLGDTVTIRGANGYSATGQAILDFGGTYPQTFDSSTTRRSLYAQSDYDLLQNLTATVGFRYENENGLTNSQGSISTADRNNFSYFLEANGHVWHRLFATAGVGLDKNAVFGFAATPRVSLAYYLRRPSSGSFVGDTKLTFNSGKGIKEPSIFDSGSSLFSVLSQLPQGPALISQFGIAPIGPERSTSFDFGVTQALWNRRATLSVNFFHNQFYNLIEFLGSSSLPLLGFPQDVVNAVAASGPGGATVNSESYRALGAEVRVEVDLGHGWRVGGNYTYLDPVVTQTFSNTPVFNTAFPGIPIGASGALVGSHPFGMAPHSGSFHVDYQHRRLDVELTGYLVTRQDGSTFLSDASFGTSMLLPNHDLNPGYQKIDLSGRFTINPAVTLFTSVENLLDQHYTAVFGFPALPLTFRAGLKLTIGGEGWKRK